MMAEIKSTLDLVMERTRNLSLSDEEKSAQRREDFSKKLNGLIQRFEDGQFRLVEIEREIGRLVEAYGVSGGRVILTGLADRLDLERDNRPLLGLLQQISRVAVGPVEAVLLQYREAVQEAEKRQSEVIRAELFKEHRISGSAVVAMPQADSGWHMEAAALSSEFENHLKQAIAEMMES